jgi:hypothetical protein
MFLLQNLIFFAFNKTSHILRKGLAEFMLNRYCVIVDSFIQVKKRQYENKLIVV